MKILVMSCDKNEDLFQPFHHCIEKYWPDHPEVIYSTESKINPYYKTICFNYDINNWTTRVHDTANKIDDEFILFMVDDIFIRDYVDNNQVLSLCNYLKNKYANINLQLNGDKKSKPIDKIVSERSADGLWKLCCMCTLWRKDAMLDLFDYSTDPWSFEKNNRTKDYKFLISNTGNIINWGRKSNKEWHFALMQGKWDPECIRFFIKEGLDRDINFLDRGIWYPEEEYHFMQLAGDCSDLGYLGNNRIKGPVDNVLTKGSLCIEQLLEDNYYDEVLNAKPDEYNHKKYFENDIEKTYDYRGFQIIHNDPSDKSYLDELKARGIVFKDFYNKVKTNPNYYFTINFNSFDVDFDHNEINNNIQKTIDTLIKYKILDKVIFVGLKATEKGRSDRHLNNISLNNYKQEYKIKYVEILNNEVWDKKLIDACYNQFLSKARKVIVSELKKCFGIVSYFPWEQPERKQRQDRLDRLIKQLSDLWPDIPIIVISQQWKFYTLEGKCKNNVIRFDYPKLGILKARQELRKHFLFLGYDYLIMFDDDAIIEGNEELAKKYIDELDKHPDGFCFIKGNGSSPYTDYCDSQLNLCAISRSLYAKEPIPNIDPQKSEAFEDRIWSTLLHFKYPDKEFDAPEGIKCIHFKNPNESAPSTWSAEKQYNWRQMRQNTKDIEAYIAQYKELPEKWKK